MKIFFLFFMVYLVKGNENACLLMLCQNDDLTEVIRLIKNFEEKYNKNYHYPYVLLNDVDFTEDFKKQTQAATSSKIEFGKLNQKEWGPQSCVDQNKLNQCIKNMEQDKNCPYGGKLSYHNMCRFFSGYFYDNDLVKKYDYYWRLEPHVEYLCNIDFDPFKYMADNYKVYGFIILMTEFPSTIPTLYQTVLKYLNNGGKQYVLTKDSFTTNVKPWFESTFNGCHYWSNFEIAKLSFFRSKVYREYYAALENSCGFYYERWGDAPVHTLAAELFLDKEDIHYFGEIGYRHQSIAHCPDPKKYKTNCVCDPYHQYYSENTYCVDLYNFDRKRFGLKTI